MSWAAPAWADDRIAELAQSLRNNSDFRLRTQAALALGASQERRAVAPLCQGLLDSNSAVRSAAAAALGKLNLGGRECLEKRLPAEVNAAVKSVITRALERLRRDEPSTDPASARVYVAIGEITNQTSRPDAELKTQLRQTLVKAMQQTGGVACAPAGETPAQAVELLQRHKQLKAVYLWPKVQTVYENGSLTVTVSVSLFTYPERSLVGSVSRKLTMTGVTRPSLVDEDDLMGAAAERLIEAIVQTAAQM